MDDYSSILHQEELLWYQKARVDWIKYEDRNLGYFHLTTILKRKRNHILTLRNDQGNWIEDGRELRNMFVEFYRDLFTEGSTSPCHYYPIKGTFPHSNAQSINRGSLEVSLSEVNEMLFEMGPYKAPGPNGFQPLFFQHRWDLVGSYIHEYVKGVMKDPKKIKQVNDTFLVLIPKVPNPNRVNLFRPIGLCNTLYKVVSKILVSKFKYVMPKIISPNQSSFVSGRHITDNILIAQEIIHSMCKTKGKKG